MEPALIMTGFTVIAIAAAFWLGWMWIVSRRRER